ncbi:MAG: hypothetical protein K0V04_28410, partial [Deltaproteobacteria bacterium]|nr:hypothetical protein [Deltaproteobacteria bacterium]
GSLLWLVPDHVCTTVNMHAEALYVRTDSIVGSAKIQARGHRPWLALGALALAVAAPSAACQPITTGIEVQLILPADDTDLQRTNNASVVLEPDGFTRSVVTDGLDFLLSFDVPPDATVRTLAVFLADDDTLLAWGRTPPFSYGGATGGLALLMARPGVLTPLDLGFSEADALALAAPVSDVGVLVMTQDGGGIFVDAYQLTLVTTASLDDPPAADDGMLVGAGDGGVVRVAWRDGLAAWRFDALDNSWTSLDLDGDLQARPGAGAWHDIESDTLWIVGGGEADDVLELPLLGTDARTVTAVEGLALDGPRREATATMLDGHLVVVGGDDPQLPLAWRADASEGAGEPMAWTASGCEQSADSPIRVLCLGGQRDGASTADAIELSIDTGALTAEVRTALLPAPIGDPQLFVDDRALYVEGDGRWVRIDRSDGTVTEPPGPAPRGTGGSTAPLPSGATLMVGGRDLDDAALEQWLVFGPDVTP